MIGILLFEDPRNVKILENQLFEITFYIPLKTSLVYFYLNLKKEYTVSNNPVTKISFSNMEELADGDTEFLADLYGEIINQFTEARDNYTKMLPDQDVEELRKIAHKVQPNIQSLEIDGIQPIFDVIKSRLMAGDKLDGTEVANYQKQLTDGFTYCIEELEKQIAGF